MCPCQSHLLDHELQDNSVCILLNLRSPNLRAQSVTLMDTERREEEERKERRKKGGAVKSVSKTGKPSYWHVSMLLAAASRYSCHSEAGRLEGQLSLGSNALFFCSADDHFPELGKAT